MPEDDQPLIDPRAGEVLLEPFEPITPETVHRLNERAKELKRLWEEAGFEWAEHERVGVPIRSLLTCSARQGVCALCYGLDLSMLKPVELGTAVGVIAAESLGELIMQSLLGVRYTGDVAGAGQQIASSRVSLGAGHSIAGFLWELEERGVGDEEVERQFAVGARGVLLRVASELLNRPMPEADSSDMEKEEQRREKQFKDALRKLIKLSEPRATGINRLEDLFEARKPKGEAIIVDYEGEVVDIVRTGIQRWVVIRAELPVGELLVDKMSLQDIPEPNEDKSPLEEALSLNEEPEPAQANAPDARTTLEQKGTAKATSISSASRETRYILRAMEEIRSSHIDRLIKAGIEKVEVLDAILVPTFSELEVEKGDKVMPGDRITPGPLNPRELLRRRGVRSVQEYLIQEIQAVYKAQGMNIDDKHIEVIIRQMFRKRRVVDPGDTYFLPGQTVDRFVFEEANAKVMAEGGKPATAEWVLLGVSESAHQTESFLSSASFQRTQKMLTEAAVRGKIDELVGLKENVIIGRLIPAGTGFVKPQFTPRFERVSAPEPTPIAVKPIETEPTLGTLFQEELEESTSGESSPSNKDRHKESPSKPKRSHKKKV